MTVKRIMSKPAGLSDPTATVAEVLSALQSTGVAIVDPGNSLTFKRIDVKGALDTFAPVTWFRVQAFPREAPALDPR